MEKIVVNIRGFNSLCLNFMEIHKMTSRMQSLLQKKDAIGTNEELIIQTRILSKTMSSRVAPLLSLMTCLDNLKSEGYLERW